MPTDEDAIRTSVNKLLVRALVDQEFADLVRDDPRAALLEAGVPEDALTGERLAPEAMFPQGDTASAADEVMAADCTDFTCWSSNCPGTCYVSLPCCLGTMPLGLGSPMATIE